MESLGSRPGTSARAQTLAKLAARLKGRSRWPMARLPALWLLTDDERSGDPLAAALTLPAGTGVVLRHYRSHHRARLAAGLAEIARDRGLTLLIGADARLARAVKAHGVHLPRWAQAERRGLAEIGLVSCSAHGATELESAVRMGADSVFLSPVFPSQSHPQSHHLGALRFAALCRKSTLPVLALGGIDAIGARRLTGSGAFGIGAIGALLPSTD